METQIVEVKSFTVKGYGLNGLVSQIPEKWKELNLTIAEKGVRAAESFGVCVSMQGAEIHYIAGLKSDLVEDLSDAEEVIIAGGKFIVAKVEGGIEAIQETFNAILQMPGVQFRNDYPFERYIHPEGSSGYDIEVWMPIEMA